MKTSKDIQLPTPPGVGISEWLAATYQVGWTFRRQYTLCRKAGVSQSCSRDRFQDLLPPEKVKAESMAKFGTGFYICGMNPELLCTSKNCRETCNRILAANAEFRNAASGAPGLDGGVQ